MTESIIVSCVISIWVMSIYVITKLVKLEHMISEFPNDFYHMELDIECRLVNRLKLLSSHEECHRMLDEVKHHLDSSRQEEEVRHHQV